MPDFIGNFPFPVIRDAQRRILELLEANWDEKRVFVIEAPTGLGKSPLAMAIARGAGSGMVLTDTKALQDQYHHDFENIGDFRGKNSFPCNRFATVTAEEAPCNMHDWIKRHCVSNGTCDYYKNLDRAMFSDVSIANYAIFMGYTQGDVRNKRSPFTLFRNVLICDEGHLLDGKLAAVASFDLKMETLRDKLGVPIARDVEEVLLTADPEILREALLRFLYPALKQRQDDLKIEQSGLADDVSNGSSDPVTMKRVRHLLKIERTLDQLQSQIKDFVEFVDDEWFVHQDRKTQSVRIAPMHAKRFFWRYMDKAAHKIIIMSASLGDIKTFTSELGLAPDEYMVIKEDSPFDPVKSPIYMVPVLSMDFRNIDSSLPLMIELIDGVLDEHPTDKGIIHANSYKVCQYILDNSRHAKRLIGKADGDDRTNQDLVLMHQMSAMPTVLVSPSMHTGIDLKGNLSRFQIIPKMPFASLGDPYIKAKCDQNGYWYQNDVWKKIIQASGRSTRTETDEAVTYVFDGAVKRSYQQFSKSLPSWFKARVIWSE